MKIKLFVSDLDGTLLYHDKDSNLIIHAKTLELVNKIKEHNVYLTLASGRHYLDILKIMEMKKISVLSPGYIIGINGAQIYNLEKKCLIQDIHFDNCDKKKLSKIYNNILKFTNSEVNLFVTCEKNQVFLIKNNHLHFGKKTLEIVNKYEKTHACKCLVSESLFELPQISKMFFSYLNKTEEIYKHKELLKLNFPDFSYTVSGLNYLEVMPKNVDKAIALSKIIEIYNLSKNEIVIMGDGGNDIEMLKLSPNSVTRTDASKDVLKVANYKMSGGKSEFVSHAIAFFLEKVNQRKYK